MSDNAETQEGQDVLRPRARIIQAIGENLISNDIIALTELIKNAYDADAKRVIIEFREPLEIDQGGISVLDDGTGMTLDVLRKSWMEPATISKRLAKTSLGGRRVTGEKGLGRFSAARLANIMVIDSTTTDPSKRVHAEFNWGEFRKEEPYLDQVNCKWKEMSVDPKTPAGTLIRLDGLRSEWKKLTFKRLRRELGRLTARSTIRSLQNFSIILDLPEVYAEYSGEIEPSKIVEHPHYSATGKVSESGHITASLQVGADTHKLDERISLDEDGHSPTCGAFEFEFRIWDRDPESLRVLSDSLKLTTRRIREDLNDICGISIYRDFFRVMPYGDRADDWLRLDYRRVQQPSLRLSNNQIVGALYIAADGNDKLQDKTNREGLIDGEALEDLKKSTRYILSKIEELRYVKRKDKRDEAVAAEPHQGLFSSLDIEPIKKAFAEKYPRDTQFIAYLEERSQALRTSVGKVQEVLVRYRRLSTLGVMMDKLMHEGRSPLTAISNETVLLRKAVAKMNLSEKDSGLICKKLDVINGQAQLLDKLFERIAPLSGKKRGLPQKQFIEPLIDNFFALFQSELASKKIRLLLPNSQTEAVVDNSDLNEIFINLINNSLYWLTRVESGNRAIAVNLNKVEDALEIVFSDSGPGISPAIQSVIFDPYFTTREDGTGLGLTIVGEIAADYDGTVDLIDPGPLPGASFRITLRRQEHN